MMSRPRLVRVVNIVAALWLSSPRAYVTRADQIVIAVSRGGRLEEVRALCSESLVQMNLKALVTMSGHLHRAVDIE